MRWLPLLALTLLACGLRFFRIDAQSLWYDEGISAFQLTRSYPEIVRAAALDSHPPFYYWSLKAWGETFGASELGLRSLSAVCGVAAVVLTFLIGQRLFGTFTGALAALLLAVAPLAVYYSQEVRMYAEVTAFGLLAVWAYTRRTYWLYALAAIATLYTQYLGVALLAAVNVHALVTWHDRTRADWLKWIAANAITAVAFLPWLPAFLDQQTRSLNTSPRTLGGLAQATLGAYGGGLVQGEVSLIGGAILVVLALVGAVLARDWRASSLALALWLVPLGLVLTLGMRSGLFELRYLVPSLPGLLLLAALGIRSVARHPYLAATAALIVCAPAMSALSLQYFDPSLARDNYRGVATVLHRDAKPSDAIVLSAPNQIEVFSYYYRGGLPTFPLPAQRPIDPVDTRQRLDQIRNNHQRVWLVSWAMNEADPRGVISTWLAENGFEASHAWYGSVQLSLIAFAPPPTATERVEIVLDNGIVLEGFRLGSRSVKPGETLALTLVWRAEDGPTPIPWKVFTHLVDSGPKVVAQRDAEPASNLRPTTGWQPGERIEDNYGIVVPDDLPAGSYTLQIGMYAGERRARFLQLNGGHDHLVLGQVQVNP